MIYSLLFIFFYGIKAAENKFALILIDKKNTQHEISLNEQDLKFFTLLHQSCNIPNNQSQAVSYSCSNEILSYESFVSVLQPLSKINFNEKRWILLPEEIRDSLGLFQDTTNVLAWIEQNQPDYQILIEAFQAANFLQLPLAIKRGIVNYLYDHHMANELNKLIDPEDLRLNQSEWLISNRGYDPFSEWLKSDKKKPAFFNKDYYTVIDYTNRQLRFLDIGEVVQKSARYFFQNVSYYFDFKNNKIQNIELSEIRKAINQLTSEGYKPVFDFTNNPLSTETKDNIVTYGKESVIPTFLTTDIENFKFLKKDYSKNTKFQNSIYFKFYSELMSLTAFYGTYLVSSKIFLQSMRKSLMYGLGALFVISPLIFYLYKNKKKIFTRESPRSNKPYFKEQIMKNKMLLQKNQNDEALSFIKTFLIGNLFFIRYTDMQ